MTRLFRAVRIWTPLLAILWTLVVQPQANGQFAYHDDADERTKEYRGLLLDRKYEQLEKAATALRKERSRSPSGSSRQIVFYRSLSSVDGEGERYWSAMRDRLVLLNTWHEAHPTVTSCLCLAAARIEAGFAARGTRFINEVQREQLAEFERQIDLAEANLDEAAQLESTEGTADMVTPWLRMKIGLAKGYTRDQMDELLKQSLEIDPLCIQAIEQMVVYLRPQWFGEEGDEQKLADQVAQLTKSQIGEGGYAIVAASTLATSRLHGFSESEFSWDRTKQGHIDLLKKLPGSVYHRCEFLRMARKAADRATAKAIAEELNGRWDTRVFERRPDFERTVRWSQDDFRSGEERLVVEIGDHHVSHVVFVGDGGRFVAGERASGIALRSAETGEIVETVAADNVEFPDKIAVSRDGNILMASRFRRGKSYLTLFDLTTRESAPLGDVPFRAADIAIGRDGSFVAVCGAGGTIRRWENHAPPLPYQWDNAHEGQEVRSLAFSPDGTKIASVGNRSVSIWDVKTRQQLRSWTVGTPWAFQVAWSPVGGRLATAGYSNQVQIWNPETGQLEMDLIGGNSAVRALAFSPGGSQLVVGTGSFTNPTVRGQLIVWDLASRKTSAVFSGHALGVLEVAVSPDGARIASASDDGTVRLWDFPGTRDPESSTSR